MMLRLAMYQARRGALNWRIHRHKPTVFFRDGREWSIGGWGFVLFVNVRRR